jgi:hypothetical protein
MFGWSGLESTALQLMAVQLQCFSMCIKLQVTSGRFSWNVGAEPSRGAIGLSVTAVTTIAVALLWVSCNCINTVTD